ncbi:fimbrial biogenesis outer membrane usher protein [Stenotrophomonas maltophilia]|nr:fimbrial biogenesis outer membrane usher protein [Stenotrophomonas maltophilia]
MKRIISPAKLVAANRPVQARTVLGWAVAITLAHAKAYAAGAPAPMEFDDGFLVNGANVDIARFTHGNPVEPGTYRVEVVANGEAIDRRDVTFVPGPTPSQALPCLSKDVLIAAGIQSSLLPNDDSGCVDLAGLIPHATSAFDVANQRLALSIPQTALERQVRGYVAPSLWDDGVAAVFIDYQASVLHTNGIASGFIGTTVGANAGAWRVRHRGSARWGRKGVTYQAMESYAQRDLANWRSQLRLGEGITRGDLFEGAPFTGVQLSSDDRMLPDSLRGYAPVVRGVARTHAKVTVRQNGYVIYETSVAPGPFAIDELYPTSHSGDLRVVVTEADGSEQHFSVNFAAVPQALREGVSRYSVSAGKLREIGEGLADDNFFAEGTWAKGINNRITAIGGAQVADDYAAILIGAALSTGVGAFGADVTAARSRLPGGESQRGASLRLNYQRSVVETGTTFGFAAYRYSTSGYLTLTEASQRRSQGSDGWRARAKHRFQFNASQSMGDRGSLFARAGVTRYWGRDKAESDFELGMQRRFGRVSYTLSAMRTANEFRRRQDSVQLTVSVPLDNVAWANSVNSSIEVGARGTSGQASISGAFADNARGSYNAGINADSSSEYDVYGGAQFDTSAGRVDATASVSSRSRSVSMGASGSVVVHSGGMNFGAPLHDGFALIHAPGAAGARVGSGARRVADNGYAIMSSVTPYRWNNIQIDPRGLSLDVELLQTTKRVVPSAGAAVKVTFETRVDDSLFLRIAVDGTDAGPDFGTDVRDANGGVVGVVGQGGVVHLRGKLRQPLRVTTKDRGECELTYTEAVTRAPHRVRWGKALCRVSATQQSEQPESPSELQSLPTPTRSTAPASSSGRTAP